MFESFLTDCGPLQHKTTFNQNTLDQLKGLLPDDLLDLLAQFKRGMRGHFPRNTQQTTPHSRCLIRW
jgi:hypothetical protein